MSNTVEYEVKIPVMRAWATGTMRGTGVVTVKVVGERTILGGCAAITASYEQTPNALDGYSAEISPNPGEEGWPVDAPKEITSKTTGHTYWIDERGLAHEVQDEEYIPDEDGSEAFGRMLERRAEAGTWWGR